VFQWNWYEKFYFYFLASKSEARNAIWRMTVKNVMVNVFYHHHIRLFEVVKRNRQHTVQKIDVGIYMDIRTIHAG